MVELPPSRRILGISLKMYFSPAQSVTFATALLPLAELAASLHLDLFFIPDFLGLALTSNLVWYSPLILGAQDCCEVSVGPRTGEVSAMHLAELGVRMVELGHAERRSMYGETDVSVALKATTAARHGLTPLICIGEPTQSTPFAALLHLRPQILSVLDALPPESDVVFAYEPVFAIGAPSPAPSEYVLEVVKEIRSLAGSMGRSGSVKIIYGGSAGPGTFGVLKDGVDGLFLGRFGQDLANLERCIREVAGA